ncbi:Peroxyureidoacrylate/ureidoacrylate amidohydrolase RutB OS=Caulobacter segnis (strain ATCC 21756 / DSM 7131 / JCM 7823 / NBRC 15250 / LMG 17158 / TK0059) GN=rutB PE=3 SV=1 [Rhizoctonia solani AG-1 IB]|uniref:Peroxyureidoacrylate/ureidoacrylate amidohydrolase RutB n=1 Tax=Thanatephorus cucumeris (strain AG1-IB / isolate 7/3/14) TaxID=1108050 RepID=A0A0B7FMQ1_THACB|nr:Peroxyureidoacrylate/ureidoacrylate amidohydrolase RutB OS=Caulobacter segnis (strain ATCC 21756 / DSM 7131 / JCM 7823 / NBRC 15250 / LMG 17158 / TK0059) GN=rutB PE=3 SV=1 [Rhizoctonia solani AG-1 IB]
MSIRPSVLHPTTYGSSHTWIEHPSGLVDLSPNSSQSLEFTVFGDRKVRLDPGKTALVIVDMQNYFLHPELRAHPTGLECVKPLRELLPMLRRAGVHVVWLNWGLEESDLPLVSPNLSRCFSKPKLGRWVDPPGLGADLGSNYGRILMKGEWNTKLYEGLEPDTRDSWANKTHMSGFQGSSDSELEKKLKEMGTRTLLFAGVNADQCVLGTVTEAFSRGYDIVVIEDLVATTSPDGGKSSLLFNALHCYGFVTTSQHILASCSR